MLTDSPWKKVRQWKRNPVYWIATHTSPNLKDTTPQHSQQNVVQRTVMMMMGHELEKDENLYVYGVFSLYSLWPWRHIQRGWGSGLLGSPKPEIGYKCWEVWRESKGRGKFIEGIPKHVEKSFRYTKTSYIHTEQIHILHLHIEKL